MGDAGGLAFGPGVDFEAAEVEGAFVAEEAGGEAEFEVAAAPDAGFGDVFHFEGAVDPSAAGPFWGADVPVGVGVEADEGYLLAGIFSGEESAEEPGGEVVEIAGAEEGEAFVEELGPEFGEGAFEFRVGRGVCRRRGPQCVASRVRICSRRVSQAWSKLT